MKVISLTFTVVSKQADCSFHAATFDKVRAAKECAGATRFSTSEFVGAVVHTVALQDNGKIFHNSFRFSKLESFLNESFGDKWQGCMIR